MPHPFRFRLDGGRPRLGLPAFVAALLGALLGSASLPGHAIGRLSDVTVRDRTTGEVLPVYVAQGRYWIEGTPGHRYAISVRNAAGGRVLAVVAVDGINAVSGETAAWHQTGYVFGPGQAWDITGWRKSDSRVAAFEFTALSASYAARTGRPDDVGVIGVALFREREPVAVLPSPPWRAHDRAAAEASSGKADRDAPPPAPGATQGAPVPPQAQAADAAPAAEARQRRAESALAEAGRAAAAPVLPERLGTGHGRSETSWVGHTAFERARATPDEVILLHYDRRERLVAMGILPPAPVAAPGPRAFPGSVAGYVPDPPRW